jgi:enoyl-CoA hydratase/carnithine racemase
MATPPDTATTGSLEEEDHGRVRLLTFNRPQAANAFDRALYVALEDALRRADKDDAIAAVVLTGKGKHFSSGTDLHEMAALVGHLDDGSEDPQGEQAEQAEHAFSGLADAVLSFRKPLLAAVNGTGIGLGFTMLLHCDIVCIARTAHLRAPFTAMGVAPEAGSSFLMPRRIGWQQAMAVLLTSEWVDADAAVRHGLALKSCDPETVVRETLELAQAIAQHPLPSLIATKALVKGPERAGVEEALAREGEAFSELLRQPGAGENVIGQLNR